VLPLLHSPFTISPFQNYFHTNGFAAGLVLKIPFSYQRQGFHQGFFFGYLVSENVYKK